MVGCVGGGGKEILRDVGTHGRSGNSYLRTETLQVSEPWTLEPTEGGKDCLGGRRRSRKGCRRAGHSVDRPHPCGMWRSIFLTPKFRQ